MDIIWLQIYICNHHYVYNCFKSGSSCKDYIRRVSDMIWVMSFHYWLERYIILFFACDTECHVIGPFPCWLLNSTIHFPRGLKPFSTSKIWEQMIWLYILTHSTSIVSRFWWLESINIYLRIILRYIYMYKIKKMLMCFRNIWNVNISIRFINHRTTFIVSMLCSY